MGTSLTNIKYIKLGASLYVPSNRNDLSAIANRIKYQHLRSVIFCTEDSIKDHEISKSLENISNMLININTDENILRYIRVRNSDILEQCLTFDAIDKIDGFVLPKVTRNNINEYYSKFSETDNFDVMLTLETPDVFNSQEMVLFRDLLLEDKFYRRILSIRIGGNDLLNHLHIRRAVTHTVYSTPLRAVISMLASTFKPFGFNLTGPVFEGINDAITLNHEVVKDLQHGLFGKSAIHPDHVPIIENHYQVLRQDLEMAEAILDNGKPAVFSMHGYMCEPATHTNWARQIIERSRCYGIL